MKDVNTVIAKKKSVLIFLYQNFLLRSLGTTEFN